MCLTKVDAILEVKRGIGYKVFSMKGGNLKGIVYGLLDEEKNRTYKTGKWIRDWSFGNIKNPFGEDYRKGFHIFRKFKDAKDFTSYMRGDAIHKVEFMNAVASGTQVQGKGLYAELIEQDYTSLHLGVIVARKIKINKKPTVVMEI